VTEGIHRVTYIGDDIIGAHTRWVANEFVPPTNKGEDCICGGFASGGKSRAMINGCECCDGYQTYREEICPCDGTALYHKTKLTVTLPPDTTIRIRYIDNTEPTF
jgi:hypothetical protein